MQIKGLHKNIYRAASYALSTEINQDLLDQRRKVLGDWELLKKKGLRETEIASITGISRATYYRRKQRIKRYGIKGLIELSRRPKNVRKSLVPQFVFDLILKIRTDNKNYGKEKITRILIRDHNVKLSCSTVGRILKSLIENGKVRKYRPSLKARRKRRFDKHAQRWTYGMKAKKMGELIQVDHMSVSKDGMNVKHFQAWDPRSKTIITEVYSGATSRAAAKFLEKVAKQMPFKIRSIQVDGGSEFMKHFEVKCKQQGIPIYVLPPKRPQWNGGVERGNRTFREDFYEDENFIPGGIYQVRIQLQKAQDKYNSYRPHHNLGGLTPFEHVNKFLEA